MPDSFFHLVFRGIAVAGKNLFRHFGGYFNGWNVVKISGKDKDSTDFAEGNARVRVFLERKDVLDHYDIGEFLVYDLLNFIIDVVQATCDGSVF